MTEPPCWFKKLCERIQVAILRLFLLMDKRTQGKQIIMSSDDMLNYHSNGDTDQLTPTGTNSYQQGDQWMVIIFRQ